MLSMMHFSLTHRRFVRTPPRRAGGYLAVVLASLGVLASPSTQAQSFTPVTGLSGGAVASIAPGSGTNASVAVVIGGLGVYTGAAASAAGGTNVTWAAQSCTACAQARNAAWDAGGRLWVAASGYGLWRGTPGGAFSQVTVPQSNVVQWVERAADGTVWAVLGNGVVQINNDGSTVAKGNNGTRLGLDKIALPATAGGTVYAASGGEVYSLAAAIAAAPAGTWQALSIPADPVAMKLSGSTLYVGTSKGVYSLNGATWTALGPTNTKVTGLAVLSSGDLAIGTAADGVKFYNSKTGWTNAASAGFAQKRVLTLAADANDVVYAGLKSGLNVVSAANPAGRISGASAAAQSAASGGLNGADVRDIVTTGNDAYALVAGQGVYSRVGKSPRWEDVSDTLDDEPLKLASTATAAYAITATGSVYRYSGPSTAVGGWQKVTTLAIQPAAFAVGANETLWVAGTSGGLFSRDATATKWTVASKGFERAGTARVLVAARDGSLYAGTSRAGVYKWDAIAKVWARVGGEGLPIVNVPGGQANSPVNAVLVDGGKLYAATNHGVFTVATNATATTAWTRVGNNLPELTTQSLTTDGNGALIAGTLNGAYSIGTSASNNSGSWAAYGGTQGEVISTVSRAGTEVMIATKAVPGKAGRVIAGG